MGSSSSQLQELLNKDVSAVLKSDKTTNPQTTLKGRLVALKGNNIVLNSADCGDKQLTLSLSSYRTVLSEPAAIPSPGPPEPTAASEAPMDATTPPPPPPPAGAAAENRPDNKKMDALFGGARQSRRRKVSRRRTNRRAHA